MRFVILMSWPSILMAQYYPPIGGGGGPINGSPITTSIIKPPSDSTSALQLTKADGQTCIVCLDTTNGRVGIGTTTPAQTFGVKGSSATDSAMLGSEQIDSTGWTSTGWTGTYPFTHSTGNTSVLSRSITGMAAGTYWQVVLTISARTTGSVSLSIGGTLIDDTAGIFAGNGSYTRGPKAVGTGALTCTPTSSFDGTVSFSVKQITPLASYMLATNDSTGAAVFRVLGETASLQNTYVGGGGIYNTTGVGNSSVGYNALLNNTTGSNNSAIGLQSLQSNTTGGFNVAIGINALESNTTGSNNNAIGLDALFNNTTGANNVAIGLDALFGNTTGNQSIAIGFNALENNTSGSNNTAVGGQSLLLNTTGAANTAVGITSLFSNTSGSTNTAVGGNALFSNTTGSNNTALGFQAGYDVTNGIRNVIVGDYPTTGVGVSTGSNNVLIGYDLQLLGRTTSNQLDIGNLIFATGLASGTTLSTGSVGIGVASPAYGLDIATQGTSGVAHFKSTVPTTGATRVVVDQGAADSSTTTLFSVNGAAAVGGGSTIIYRCTVAGNLRVGQLTSVSADCGTAVDSGLRTN